ncbi:hypothetical protein [Roseibium sp. M-1]
MTNQPVLLNLKSLLVIDAATCLATGALLAVASGPISALTQIDASLLFWAGLFLFPVALFMGIFSRVGQVPGWAASIVIYGNLLWVLASVALPVLGLIAPNALGWTFLLAQAAAVTVLTLLEWQAAQNRVVAA